MMSNNSSRTWLTTALVVGAGALSAASVAGMAGVMSMQKANRNSHRQQVVGMRKSGMMRGMMHGMGCMGEEMADEFCMMAHKTGNAMIRCGRFINKMVP
ncbi:MAG TPA: hypothetical protein IAB00_02810 [Candidatus Avidehalobacter gallistercoris]|uniref:Uncharacterized protein n=1 Tax=Candidatus Avidehalobacter gallistercoris TaxID=2840694 RepID=A0A9D1HLL3_9FIRM|nr:hypothetical protein [Candidatus Avidehalobacter gallistercoris]